MIEEAPEIEVSPLGGIVARDGMTVHVEIYRLVEGDESWTLEVTDHEGGSTVWEDRFTTDNEAHAEFYRVLETDGIQSFLEDQPESRRLVQRPLSNE
jgi:hypothetical protein